MLYYRESSRTLEQIDQKAYGDLFLGDIQILTLLGIVDWLDKVQKCLHLHHAVIL